MQNTHPFFELFPIRFAIVRVENQWMNAGSKTSQDLSCVNSVLWTIIPLSNVCVCVCVCVRVLVYIYMCIVYTVQVLFRQFPSKDPQLNSFRTVPHCVQ